MTRISILRLKRRIGQAFREHLRPLSMTRISILRLKRFLAALSVGNGAWRAINDKNLNSEIETDLYTAGNIIFRSTDEGYQ